MPGYPCCCGGPGPCEVGFTFPDEAEVIIELDDLACGDGECINLSGTYIFTKAPGTDFQFACRDISTGVYYKYYLTPIVCGVQVGHLILKFDCINNAAEVRLDFELFRAGSDKCDTIFSKTYPTAVPLSDSLDSDAEDILCDHISASYELLT